MKHQLLFALAAVSLSACQSFPPGIQAQALQQFGSRCDGDYWGNTGLGASIGFKLTCVRPKTTATASEPAPSPFSPEQRAMLDALIADSVAKALAAQGNPAQVWMTPSTR